MYESSDVGKVMDGFSNLTPGANCYLYQAGQITQNTGDIVLAGILQIVGYAKSATEVVVKICCAEAVNQE